MSLESAIHDAVAPLVGGRFFPDVAQPNKARPYGIFQQVGGTAANFLEASPVGKRNARVQISLFANTRKEANDLARQAEDALIASPDVRAYVLSAFLASYIEDLELYATRQDFSVWY